MPVSQHAARLAKSYTHLGSPFTLPSLGLSEYRFIGRRLRKDKATSFLVSESMDNIGYNYYPW